MNNCLFFALSRWNKKGGYLIIRRSRFGWWWHFLWAEKLDGIETLEHYVPNEEKLKVEVVSKVLFKGHVSNKDEL
jgi:hypothetical protein